VKTDYLVFGSAPDAHVDVAVWDAQARRFFDTRLALAGGEDAATEPSENPSMPDPSLRSGMRAIRIEIVPPDGPAGQRTIAGRPRRPEDLALAELAEARAGGGGLVLVARRCPTVWLVMRQAEDDPLALRLAMILASVLLGPVLDPRTPELFGVKTARQKLERREAR
jgi:hypothetical protein